MVATRWPSVEGEWELETEWEDEHEYEDEAEWEDELEGEWEDEAEAFVNPLRRIYPDAERALMEHLGQAAAEAESEDEAEAFIGALLPIAAKLVPKIAPAVMKAAPQLIRGMTQLTSGLRSAPQTRGLVKTLPTIMARTVQSLDGQARNGRPLTGQRALQTFARQTQRVLSQPSQRAKVVRRSNQLDRQYHGGRRCVCR
jgi:hypothetical protein